MKSAYTMAIAELKKRREENSAEHARRLNQVRGKSPEFVKTEHALAVNGAALIRTVADKSSDFTAIESNIRRLQQRKSEILAELKLPSDYLDDIYTCSICRDTGFEESGARCNCLKQLAAQFVCQNSNLTEHMKKQRFENFDFSLFSAQPPENGRDPLTYIKHFYEKGINFSDTFDITGANLLLTGNAGTGKTYFSSCIANRAMDRGKTVYYQTAFTLFDILEKLKFGRCTREEQERFEGINDYIMSTELLIIDDLGTEYISAYSTAALFNIINSRCYDNKSTILSTNLSLEALTSHYSQRFTSRICGDFEFLRFIGRDLRMSKLKTQQ